MGKGERGATLVELIVAIAVGALVILAAGDLELMALRLQHRDEGRFASQAGAALVADAFARGVRQSASITLASGGATLTLRDLSGSMTLSLDPATGEVVRQSGGQSQVLATGVQRLGFYREADGRTLRMELSTTMAEGAPLLLVTRAIPRQ